jgi:hypothetical protein
MDSRFSNWDSEGVASRSGPSAALWTVNARRVVTGMMVDGLSGGSPTLGPAFGPATHIATVLVRGVFNLRGAPILRAASAPRPGGNLGSGIPGQGESIVRRLMPC